MKNFLLWVLTVLGIGIFMSNPLGWLVGIAVVIVLVVVITGDPAKPIKTPDTFPKEWTENSEPKLPFPPR